MKIKKKLVVGDTNQLQSISVPQIFFLSKTPKKKQNPGDTSHKKKSNKLIWK